MATVAFEKSIDFGVHRDMAFRYFGAGADQRLQDLRVDFRIATVRSRPQGLSEDGTAIHVRLVEWRFVFQKQLQGVEPSEDDRVMRSEEHTSELQSQFHLVCRLLLEKK